MSALGIHRSSFLLRTLGICALAANAIAQSWAVQFGSVGFDTSMAVAPDGLGGTFSAGHTSGDVAGANAGSDDVFVVRTGADGGQLWAIQIGTGALDNVGGIAPDGAGGLFVAGSTAGAFTTSAGSLDGFLARCDAQGHVLWTVNAGTPQADGFDAVVGDGAGGAIAVGRTAESPPDAYRLWIVRFDGFGVVQSSMTLPVFGDARPTCATADGAGGTFIGGRVQTSTSTDGFLARLTHTGDVLWTRFLASSGSESVEGVGLDGAGGVYAVGRTNGALGIHHGAVDGFLARYDAAGDLGWLQQLGTARSDSAWSVASDGVGGAVVAGDTWGDFAGTSGGGLDGWLMRFDGAGTATWGHQVAGATKDVALGVCTVAPGEFVAVGETYSDLFATQPSPSSDAWIARFRVCALGPATSYCVASPNSTGQGATIAALGSTDLSLDDFTLNAAGCPAGEIGLFLMGNGQASIPFGDGVLCLDGDIWRIQPALVTDVLGAASLALDFSDPTSHTSQISAGETWNFQFWYRDTASSGAGFNLSDAMSATFCP
jgi:hypothetical protein